ncbi:uncharacterized protein LOC130798947 [Amaranthus tricolor]|uniref:uncharacterized protein LOC130798947 n=1 Tax=Amaranthus tricolor TaxID=29722 RepID=UPI00258FE9DE|nr:uncharacterized protein LOC130798947 [Amaranthus tricolor]
MAPFEALYGRKCRTPLCWEYLDTNIPTGPSLIQESVDLGDCNDWDMNVVIDRIWMMWNPRNYGEERRYHRRTLLVSWICYLEATLSCDLSFLRNKFRDDPVYSVNGKSELLQLPPELDGVHNVFHMSQLRKYMYDPSHILSYEPLQVDETLSYEEKPLKIIDQQVKELRNKSIPLVKVLWTHHGEEEATWEKESDMRSRYPHLF